MSAVGKAEDAPLVLGRYELVAPIGRGGMAEVHLAVQRGPAGFEKLVVVKLVHERLASQRAFVDMLLDEAKLATLVKHPNVVDIYELGEHNGRYFIAMEYLEGEPLLELLRVGGEGSRLDPLSTARLIADTAEGLDAAHRLKSRDGKPLELVHHDVSLGNIVVLYSGLVKLVDFGVAKAAQSAPAGVAVQGKLGYMAPEKLLDRAVDRRSDIWSLGCVLWEALTLRRLFRGDSDAETVRQVLEREIAPPSTIDASVPPELDPIVARAVQRDPEQRYQTAKAFAADLEEVLRDHKYGARNDRIAQYMERAFADRIVARERVLQDVASKRPPSAEVLAQAFAESSPAARTISSTGDGPRPADPEAPEAAPEPAPEPAAEAAPAPESAPEPAPESGPAPEPAPDPAGVETEQVPEVAPDDVAPDDLQPATDPPSETGTATILATTATGLTATELAPPPPEALRAPRDAPPPPPPPPPRPRTRAASAVPRPIDTSPSGRARGKTGPIAPTHFVMRAAPRPTDPGPEPAVLSSKLFIPTRPSQPIPEAFELPRFGQPTEPEPPAPAPDAAAPEAPASASARAPAPEPPHPADPEPTFEVPKFELPSIDPGFVNPFAEDDNAKTIADVIPAFPDASRSLRSDPSWAMSRQGSSLGQLQSWVQTTRDRPTAPWRVVSQRAGNAVRRLFRRWTSLARRRRLPVWLPVPIAGAVVVWLAIAVARCGGGSEPAAPPPASGTTAPATPSAPIEIEMSEDVVRTAPNPATLYSAGLEALRNGDTAAALAALTRARELDASYPPAWYGLGLVYERIGKRDDAKAAYQRYLELSPNAANAEQIRAQIERL